MQRLQRVRTVHLYKHQGMAGTTMPGMWLVSASELVALGWCLGSTAVVGAGLEESEPLAYSATGLAFLCYQPSLCAPANVENGIARTMIGLQLYLGDWVTIFSQRLGISNELGAVKY